MDNDPLKYPFYKYVFIILISIFAGVIQLYEKYTQTRKKINIIVFIGDILTSAFVGLLVFWITEDYGLTGNKQAVIVAISAHSGAIFLSILEEKVIQIIKRGKNDKYN